MVPPLFVFLKMVIVVLHFSTVDAVGHEGTLKLATEVVTYYYTLYYVRRVKWLAPHKTF